MFSWPSVSSSPDFFSTQCPNTSLDSVTRKKDVRERQSALRDRVEDRNMKNRSEKEERQMEKDKSS